LKKQVGTFIKLAIFLSIGVILIWLSIKNLTEKDKADILHSFKSANYWWILLTILIGLTSHFIRAIRWKRMLKPLGYNPSLKNTFFAVMIGYFANLAIPRLGEVTRCGILNRYEKIPINKSLGTVVTERALDLLIFFLLFFLTIFLQADKIISFLNSEIYPSLRKKYAFLSNIDHIAGTLFLAGIFTVFVLFIIFRKRFERFKLYMKFKELFLGFWHGLKSLLKMEKAWLFVLETFFIWVFYFLMVYLCFFSLEETSTLSLKVGLAVLVLGSIGIMVTPGGIGLYPIIIEKTLALYFITEATGFALGWLTWSAQTLMIITAGTVSLILLSFNKRKNESTGDIKK
jgi:uncharacterized protein (TIRG00374 family)